MSVREAIKGQIIAGLANAKFPITTSQELLSAFPNGADTACKAGDYPHSNIPGHIRL